MFTRADDGSRRILADAAVALGSLPMQFNRTNSRCISSSSVVSFTLGNSLLPITQRLGLRTSLHSVSGLLLQNTVNIDEYRRILP